MENKEPFQYKYSAKEQEEIKKIRSKYEPSKEEDKLARLKKLDSEVYKKGAVIALTLGIIGILILGSGMSLIMTDIGKIIGINQTYSYIVGIISGIIGIFIISIAYPIYNRILKKERKRIAPEIIRLSDELMK